MIDVYEMIQMKENQIARVQKEIQALHLVAQILLDQDDGQALSPNGDSGAATFAVETGVFVADLPLGDPSPQSSEVSPESMPPKRRLLRDWFGIAAGE